MRISLFIPSNTLMTLNDKCNLFCICGNNLIVKSHMNIYEKRNCDLVLIVISSFLLL